MSEKAVVVRRRGRSPGAESPAPQGAASPPAEARAVDRGAGEGRLTAAPVAKAEDDRRAIDLALSNDRQPAGSALLPVAFRGQTAAPEPAAPAEPASDESRTTRHVDILAPEREARPGQHPGDRAVRLRRRRVQGMRRLEPGVYEIVSEPEPTSRFFRTLRRLNRTLVGAPIRSEHEAHERLSKTIGIAAFGTDNISSSAYATEELMRVLVAAGTGALVLTMPISFTLMALLAIVVVSYQQTIRAYPKGGGSYIVSSENLGTIPGLVAGASILVDYVLTVAVSVSAGVSALTSFSPGLYDQRVVIAVLCVALIAWGNLRGLRESGMLFAAPLYVYLLSWIALLAYGFYRYFTGDAPVYVPPPEEMGHAAAGGAALGLFLILRAFASGAVGLTGTEAIADGVAAFKEPTDRNARVTLIVMACCFASIFLGISFLSSWLHIIPDPAEVETVNSQLTRTLVGTNWFYYIVQVSTFVLLILAANTAFADFPRLAYFMARDKFLPSQFKERGGRLAFSNGIFLLAVVASVLIVIFQGSVTALIPLYTIGVFVAFTLSQSGLVMRWWRLRERGWQWRLVVNAIGAAVTTTVAIVVAITKFALGAWVVLILIPVLVLILMGIQRHFFDVAQQLAVDPDDRREHPDKLSRDLHHYVLIPVVEMNRAALQAIAYARSLTGHVEDDNFSVSGPARAVIQAVHVTDDAESADDLQRRWEQYGPGVELVIVESPFRALTGPLLRYIDAVESRHPEGTAIVTVLLPEYMPARWWENFLHTQTSLRLKGALLFRPRTAVASVPFHLHA